jgi:hypothetical protein
MDGHPFARAARQMGIAGICVCIRGNRDQPRKAHVENFFQNNRFFPMSVSLRFLLFHRVFKETTKTDLKIVSKNKSTKNQKPIFVSGLWAFLPR